MPLTIAIDGPVGAGKSTISDEVANRLGILHLDTGAMYRAVGLAATGAGIDPADEKAVSALCEKGGAQVDIRYENGKQITLLNGEDVSSRIRTQEAGGAASAVSRYPAVRSMLVKRQQEMAKEQPMIMDGRDIGTVVLPKADVKFFLTASAEVRAKRRTEELTAKGQKANYNQVLKEIQQRDYQDTHREVAPLKMCRDSIKLDTSELDIDGVVAEMKRIIAGKIPL